MSNGHDKPRRAKKAGSKSSADRDSFTGYGYKVVRYAGKLAGKAKKAAKKAVKKVTKKVMKKKAAKKGAKKR